MWPRFLSIRRERTVQTWSGLPVPAATRMVSQAQLRVLVEAAEQGGLGWDVNGMLLGQNDAYLLVPYSYEAHPVSSWKCRVLNFVGGLSVEAGKGKKVFCGRLDISVVDYR